MSGNKKILVADDHEIVRRGVRNLLETVSGWEVCGEASTGNEAIDMAKNSCPDVIVLDISMPPSDGLAVARELQSAAPESRVLIFSMHDSEEMVRSMLAAGVKGYILKSDADRQLISAVETLLEGGTCFSPKVTDTILGGFLRGESSGTTANSKMPLSPREIEVSRLLAAGKSNKEIAAKFFISVKTVETHRRNIMQKLQISSIVELVHWSIKNHLIDASN